MWVKRISWLGGAGGEGGSSSWPEAGIIVEQIKNERRNAENIVFNYLFSNGSNQFTILVLYKPWSENLTLSQDYLGI